MRLALGDAGAAYVDTALVPQRKGGGVPALERYLDGNDADTLQFGNEAVGSTSTQTVGVRNCGDVAWSFTGVAFCAPS